MTEALSAELTARARAWMDADPDPETRAELAALLAAGLHDELTERLGPELDFGTAGLRGAVGAGPARMNRAVVLRATRALAEQLLESVRDARVLGVVIGYDARPSSRALAEAAAGVMLAAGLAVRWFPQPTPTPLVAYAARVLCSAAALVVTASHNPREDNGLKVYGSDAIQLGPPLDRAVAARRESVGPAKQIPCLALPEQPRIEQQPSFDFIGPELFERYLAELEAVLPPRLASPALRIVYTPLHGVGRDALLPALAARGFTPPALVVSQSEPDGTFPTTPFPNPEVKGTLDLALELAQLGGADVVLANDPDADRLAAALPRPSGRFETLSGNELGVLLADFVLGLAPARPTPLLVTSIVSSPLLLRIAAEHGARGERTLTGFKWIWAAAQELVSAGGVRFAFGCEEALGYSIGSLVRDKDGIAAAVWFAELTERARREGLSPWDRLHQIYRRHGAWASAQRSLTRPGSAGAGEIQRLVERLTSAPPDRIGERSVRSIVDYRTGAESRAPWLGRAPLLELILDDEARVLVRPSGTEPKLKVYADVRASLGPSEAPASAERRARASAAELTDGVCSWFGAE